ncbi:hypothetical protein SDC9_111730 [bioreactor metagenome]|uniref:Uncharacterized protein n=1 Tax=bioreactor metagenome TaxID=1076179 RepID=A0A645BH91_9ZZZZ
MRLAVGCIQRERGDEIIVGPSLLSGRSPCLFRQVLCGVFAHFNRLHHLADDSVGHNEHRVTVPVSKVKGLTRKLYRLLNVAGC